MSAGDLVKVVCDRLGSQWRGHYGRIEYVTWDGLLNIRLIEPNNVSLVLHPQEVCEVADCWWELLSA